MQKKKYRLSRIEYLLFYAIMTSTKLAEEMRKILKKFTAELRPGPQGEKRERYLCAMYLKFY